MGDKVEPRREFIELNAKYVKILTLKEKCMSRNRNQKNIVDVDIEKEMKSSYLDYAIGVIVARALPDVKVGLNLYTEGLFMLYKGLGLMQDKPYKVFKTCR